MKLTTLLLLVGLLQLSATNYAQAQRISISMEDGTFYDLVSQIEKQSEFMFFYNSEEINNDQKINIKAGNKLVTDILNEVLTPNGLTYRIDNKHIIITKTDKFNQQVKQITGVIKDENGDPIIGANVTEKGTSNGVITNLDGNFTLTVDENAVLQISYIGYIMQEVHVRNQSHLDIVMQEDLKTLDEVIVVGYGTQKKVNLTGAVSNIQMDELANRPITSASNVLQGKVPGVYSLQKSGKAGDDGAVINIRGVGTLNDSNPLILIDGLPGDMNDVDSRDIESVSVLKDAASSAIYGNRAANGVVLITTRKGSQKKTSVSYSGYFGVQKATSLPSVFGSAEYARLYNEAALNSGQRACYTDAEISLFEQGTDPMYPNINYFKQYYDDAPIQNHHVNVSGGAENLHYAFMLGYLDQDGILVGNKYNRFDFRSNFDAYFLEDKRLRLTARLSGNRGKREEPTNEWDAIWYALNAPIWPLKDTDGNWVAVAGERNHYAEIKEGSTTRFTRNYFSSQFEAEFKIIDGLSAQASYGFNLMESNSNAFKANVDLYTMDGIKRPLISELTVRNNRETRTLFTTLLRYEKKFGKHDISLLAGYSQEEFKSEWNSGYRSNFVNNDQRVLNMGDPSTMKNDAKAWDLGLQSYFGRVNYVLADKYLFEANIRRDGSSRFQKGSRWGTFPSFSAGWILSEEKFMKGIDWMDMLKVRASWGQLGNQNINSFYAASDILTTNQNYSLNGKLESGVAVNLLTNKMTTWETSEQMNIGIDFAFLNDFNINFEYFKKTTKDILMQVPIPLTLGNLQPPYLNVGKVENRGFELGLTYRKTFNKDLRFSGTFNVSHIKNEILSLNGRSPIIGVRGDQTVWKEGDAINAFYGYKTDGNYQISDFNWQNNSDPSIPHNQRTYTLKDGVVTLANYTPQPGDLKYRDLDGDNHVDMDNDRTVIGKQFPDLTYALQLNLDYKNFDLSLFFQGVQGIDGYTYLEIATPFSGTANTGTWWRDRWTPENQTNKMPRLTLDAFRNHIHSDFYMEDASYLRLKNIELGYTLPEQWLSRIGISNLRVYANMQNALTFTKFRGFDPEQTVDQLRAHAYPQVRITTIGLNITF